MYLLWAPTTRRLVRAIPIVGGLSWLLMMLSVLTMNVAEQAAGTWLWLAPAGLLIGPVLALVLRFSWVRRWSAAIRRVLAAGAFVGAAGLSLWAAHQDRVIGILGALCGVGWGVWQVEQWRLRDLAKTRAEEERLAEQRHEELLREIRRARACEQRVAGYRRRVAGRSAPAG